MRILLVENSEEWQRDILRGLPEYEVDLAESYEEALSSLDRGSEYVLSIVDLNLNDSEEYNREDRLGGEVLDYLRKNYPAMRRIALTGRPPATVRQIFDQYDVDELLLKERLTIADLREAVRMALARRPSGVPSEVKVQASEIWAELRGWRDQWLQGYADRTRLLKSRIGVAGLPRQDEVDAGRSLADLESLKGAFESQCRLIENILSHSAVSRDLSAASESLERLKREFNIPEQTNGP